MARPQAADYEDRLQFIVDRAAALFAEQGFHKTSISEIADACGTSKSLIYHYFNAKEDILYAVMKDHTELLLKTAGRITDQTITAEQKLREIARGFMAIYVHAQAQQVVLLNELGSLPPDQRKKIVSQQNQVVDKILGIIEEIAPDLKRDKARRKPTVMAFMGMLNWTHTWFRPKGAMTDRAFANLACDLFLGGLRSHSSTTI